MQVVFLECCQLGKKGGCIDAHVRQCFELADYLNRKGHSAKVLFNDTMEKETGTAFDAIVVSYGSFYANTKGICRIIERNPRARLYWLTNEYDLSLNGSVYKVLRTRGFKVIANFERSASRYNKIASDHIFLNLNLLFFRPKAVKAKKYRVCYFGTFRKDRAEYFKKYLNSKDFILSTSAKNFKKFQSIGCTFRPVGKFVWGKTDTLGLFQYSLYIEDEFTHSHFNNLADRFYEALSNEVVTLFDRSVINTLRKSELSGLGFEDFLIDDPSAFKTRNYAEDWERQKQWIPIIESQKNLMLSDFEKALLG